MERASFMKLRVAGVLVLALANLVASDSVAIPTECPETDTGNNTVNLAHETDCTKYYGCSGGLKWLKECPVMDAEGNRLHFNPVLQVCDWPQNVNCKLPNPSAAAAMAREADLPTECPSVDGDYPVHLAHESDCTKFYKCSKGKKYVMDCAPYNAEGDRLYFNATLQVCDWPANVDCQQPNPSAAEKVESVVVIPTECPAVDGEVPTHLAHASDCTKFYKCNRGTPVLMSCPPYNAAGDRLYFNASLQICDWPWDVDCQQSHPSSSENVESVVAIPTECPAVDGEFPTHLAHESDCTKFYKCNRGTPVLMSCPPYNAEGDKLYFNASLQICDWPWNVDCQQPSTSSISPTSVTVRPTGTVVPTIKPTGTVVPTIKPTGTVVPTVIPTGTHTHTPTGTHTNTFTPTGTHTNTFTPTGTHTHTFTPTGSYSPTVAPTGTYTPTSTPTYAPTITPTPTATYSVRPTASVTSSVTPTLPPVNIHEGCIGSCPDVDPIEYTVLLANEDCHKFCYCSNGTPWVETCAADLHFSPSENACAQPEDAKCANGPYAAKVPSEPQVLTGDDEAIMNILGFNDRFRW